METFHTDHMVDLCVDNSIIDIYLDMDKVLVVSRSFSPTGSGCQINLTDWFWVKVNTVFRYQTVSLSVIFALLLWFFCYIWFNISLFFINMFIPIVNFFLYLFRSIVYWINGLCFMSIFRLQICYIFRYSYLILLKIVNVIF